MAAIELGSQAPKFALHATPDQKVALDDFKDCNVVLAFYPADWSPVCSDELAIFNEIQTEFKRLNAKIIGISVDGTWCHLAFAKDRKLHFPLLSDFEPKGTVSKAYGVYRNEDGVSDRALFVIDQEGIVRWKHVSPVGVNPGVDGVLDALESLQTCQEKK